MVTCRSCGNQYDPDNRPVCPATGRRCTPLQAPKPAEPVVDELPDPLEALDGADFAGDTAEATQPDAEATQPDTEPGEAAGEPDDDPELDDDGDPQAGLPYQQRRYDWIRIRARYVEGVNDGKGGIEWPSLDAVAAHFHASPNRVREKSAMEGWRAMRTQWQAKIDATRQAARANALAKRGLDLDNAGQQVAQFGLQLCSARLAEMGQAAQAARADAGPGATRSGIDSGELTKLAAAADVFHKLGLRAIGDPELHRVELSGPNGQPIEIAQELRRDDPSRIAGVLAVLQQAGLGDLFGTGEPAALATLEAHRRADGTYEAEQPRG